jgi:hypothetical protein
MSEVAVNERDLGRVGVCIYCGATDGLQDEHVIPFGIGGPAKLFDATCASCAEMTSAFERLVQRDQLGAFRCRSAAVCLAREGCDIRSACPAAGLCDVSRMAIPSA